MDEDWPLHFLDHNGENHQIVLKPGEMLFYESCVSAHGRQEPLNGDYFDNMFVHFTFPYGTPEFKKLGEMAKELKDYEDNRAFLEPNTKSEL